MSGLKTVRELVREEIEDGASLHHVYDQLNEQHQAFSSRLVELKQHHTKADAAAPSSEKENAQ